MDCIQRTIIPILYVITQIPHGFIWRSGTLGRVREGHQPRSIMPYKEMNSRCPNVCHFQDLALLYFEDDSHREDYQNSVRYQCDTVMSTNQMGRYKMTYKITAARTSFPALLACLLAALLVLSGFWKPDTSHYHSLQSFAVHSAQSNCVISAESGNIF